MRDNFLLLLWRCWHVRNQIKHEGASMPIEGSVRFLVSYQRSLVESSQQATCDRKGKARLNTIPLNCKPSAQVDHLHLWWQPPQPGYVKVNVDAGLKDGYAGLGIIARDAQGSVLFASSQIRYHCSDPEVAETMALIEGLRLAIQWIDLPVIVETDCLSLCKAINSSDDNRSEIALLLKEAKLLGDELRRVEFIHYNRLCNRVAHELGQHACKSLCSKVWIKRAPDFVGHLLDDVCNPVHL